MNDVSYCENSTINEAWVLLLGIPAKPTSDEVTALLYAARGRIATLERRPSLVLVEQPTTGILPPHWQHQVSWNDGHHLARLGHQYLSVHFLKVGANRYATYEHSLKPQLHQWLELLTATLAGQRDQYMLDRVCFGYLNSFDFDPVGFDLSRYFRLGVEIGVKAAENGLDSLRVTFRVTPTAESDVVLGLWVESDPLKGKVCVRTKTVAEQRSPALSLLDIADIHGAVTAAKRAAKKAFFEFATDETHRLMGAHHADPS